MHIFFSNFNDFSEKNHDFDWWWTDTGKLKKDVFREYSENYKIIFPYFGVPLEDCLRYFLRKSEEIQEFLYFSKISYILDIFSIFELRSNDHLADF